MNEIIVDELLSASQDTTGTRLVTCKSGVALLIILKKSTSTAGSFRSPLCEAKLQIAADLNAFVSEPPIFGCYKPFKCLFRVDWI